MPSTTRASHLIGPALIGVGLLAALAFTLNFPAVEGLGTKVRLPVFHGAMTWVNLALFSALAVVALAFLVTRRRTLYSWVEALRWVAIPLWLVGSALGLLAALNTWDFTGSKSAPLEVAAADPRLIAQFWIVLAALGVLALALLVEDRRWLAVADTAFVALTWAVIMQAVLGPGRALHPDSPVLNSPEILIKLMFVGIIAGLSVAMFGATLAVKKARESAAPGEAAA